MPESYTEERPGFRYSHIQHQNSINEDPLASRLPKATDRPSFHPDAVEFNSLARTPDTPLVFEDFIVKNAPQLSIHIVSFEDATLVTLTWAHSFCDAMGMSALLHAWTLVLNGKENEVPPLHGFDFDPLAKLGSEPSEKSVLANLQLKGLNMAIFGLKYVFELMWYRQEEGRTVCIPASFFSSIKEEALQELKKDEPEHSFLSDGDVLSAWISRSVLQNMPWAWHRTIVIMNAFSLRGVLSKSLLPSGTSYISNGAAGIYAVLPCDEILSKPTSFTASAVRSAITEQGTESQMDSFIGMLKQGPPVFGDSSTIMIVITNWTKGKFYETDFSSAVIKEGIPVSERANAIGRPSYAHCHGHSPKYPSRNAFPIFGKDAAGNYWMSGRLRAGVWDKIEESLKSM